IGAILRKSRGPIGSPRPGSSCCITRVSLTSPAEGSDSSSAVPLDPPPAVEPLGRVREYHPLHCRTPWSRTSTLGYARTGEAGAALALGATTPTHSAHGEW